ncbi:MAG: hypothetical protein DI626_09275 [Micavibrio aeruginosavorus]|uniref:AsmA domain-containing protein n=1 Tax=Micavibrio aeruginosavorus TaxID=349221 RepID=A0A2W4ZLK1_9BACT|nr:MAG: hypothetical protein DI626_09275 [Micavibrio aeruginosavorus]
MSDKLIADQNAKAEQGADAEQEQSRSGGNEFSLDKLTIEDGRIAYKDIASGAAYEADKINLDVRADTLAGPFGIKGDLRYNNQTIKIDAETKAMSGGKKEMPVDATVSLPDANASAKFNGVVAMEPLEIQGKMNINADNLSSVIALGGGAASPALGKKLSFSGLVTANEEQVRSQEIDIAFGETKGKGNILVSGLKEKNPVTFTGDMAFEGIINLDQLGPTKPKGSEPSVEEKVAKGQKLSGDVTAATLLPESLTLPFPVNGTLKVSADGIQSNGQLFKGVVLDASKEGSAIDVSAKALDLPGKSRVEGTAALRFTSVSQSEETGVTYADPSVSFRAAGTTEQLPTLLRAFVPEQKDNAALEIWKTARLDMDGTITPTAIKVTNGNVTLDQNNIVLSALYEPKGTGGMPNVVVDLTTDTIDVDTIQGRLNGQKKQAVQKDPAAKTDVKKALEPVRAFSVPVNLTFDVSVQKAIFNAQTISGIRAKGRAAGQSIDLDVVSAQDYMGAAASLSGRVGNLADLSGIDLKFYGKTSDVKALMQQLKMDTSKLPQSIGAAEVNAAAKGIADKLAFDARVSALEGQVEAKGNMTGLLDKPSFSDLSVGAKHPNFVRAMQIVNPSFAGSSGLARPFSFYTDAVANGDVYDLSNLKANLGPTSIGGALKINMAGARPSVNGSIEAGSIPLDDFLGAKDTGGGSSSGGAGGSANAGGGKWSRDTIETGWMHSVDLDLGLSAQAITYGGWNFQNPKTKITLKDGNLLVDNLNAGLFGGTANLTAKVQDPADAKQPLGMAVQSKMTQVSLEKLVTALSGTRKLQATGNVSFDMNVQSTGLSPHALVSALQGKATLDGQNVVMKGFDLAQIGLAFVDSGKPMDRLNSIVGGAVSGGETRFDTIKGGYDIMQGVVTISSMAMDGPAANIVSKGNVNLPQWMIDTIHTITFKQAKDAGAFDVAIKGSLSNPGNTFGKGLFNDVLTRRLQQKAIEKLPDVLGKDLSGKLQGLGILPQKQQQPATAPAPAQDGTAQPDAAAPAEQEQPQQKTPEQQMQDDAGKAIKGVLDGLLR